MIRLWPVHALGILPRKVPQQAQDGKSKALKPEDGAAVQLGNDAVELGRKGDHGGDGAVDGDEDPPNGHGAGNGNDMVLGPVAGDKAGLAEDREEDGCVEGGTPHPVAGDLTVLEYQVAVPDELAKDVKDDGVVDGVEEPFDEYLHTEKLVLLAHAVQLRVPIEEARRDELIKNAEGQGRKNGIEDVIKGECP